MGDRRTTAAVSVCLEQWKSAFVTPRVYLGYFMCVGMVIMKCYDYMNFCRDKGMQIFEPFIIALSDTTIDTVIMFGLFLILLDSPFINARTSYIVTRGSRKGWYWGTIFYLCTQVLFCYGISFGATVAMGFPRMYLQNSWSMKCYYLTNNGIMGGVINWQLYFPASELIQLMSPAEVFGCTFLLQILYSMLLLSVAYVINMKTGSSVGNISMILLHMTGVLLSNAWTMSLNDISIYRMSHLLAHPIGETGVEGVGESSVIFLMLLAAVLAVGRLWMKRLDYNMVRAGRDS